MMLIILIRLQCKIVKYNNLMYAVISIDHLNPSNQDTPIFTASWLFLPPWCALAAVPQQAVVSRHRHHHLQHSWCLVMACLCSF